MAKTLEKKQVRERNTDSSAFVVLNKKGEHCANVQFYYSNGGRVYCDVWARNPGESWLSLIHQSYAGGYGYDKAAAALAGAVIEGYKLANHCGTVEEKGEKAKARLFAQYKRDCKAAKMTDSLQDEYKKKAQKIGARFANYCRNDITEQYSYQSLHFEHGLERLKTLGFQVIQAI